MNIISKLKLFLNDKKIETILKGAKLSFVAKIISVFLGLIINYIVANYYGADVVGVLSLITSIILLISIFTTFGLQDAIIKIISEFKHKYNMYFMIVYKKVLIIVSFLSIPLSFVLFLFHKEISVDFFNKPFIDSLVFYTSFFIIFYAIHQINIATIRSLKKINIFAFFQMLPNLIMFIILLIAVNFSNSQYIPIYVYLLTLFLLFLSSSILILYIDAKENIPHYNEKRNDSLDIKFILKKSFPMMLTSSMFIIASQIDIFMLGILKSTKDVGIYAIANKIAVIVTFVTVAINSMIAPEFSELFHKNKMDELKYVAQKSTKLIFFATTPIIIFLIIFGNYILGIFGEDFIVGYVVLLILLFGQSINSIVGSTGNFLNMTNNQNKLMLFVFISLVVNIIMNYILIPIYGINGAAFATMFSVALWNILATFYINKKFGFYILYSPFRRGKNV